MSHDFLTSMHSAVIGAGAQVEKPAPKVSSAPIKEGSEPVPIVEDDRHRTVGVSMSPKLRLRAVARAKALGLPFSRYVQWCVEAELDGSTLEERVGKRRD